MCSAVALDQLQLRVNDKSHLISIICLKLEIPIPK